VTGSRRLKFNSVFTRDLFSSTFSRRPPRGIGRLSRNLEGNPHLAQSTASPTPTLGFMTVVHEPRGYVGGYLVTNLWGRPLEFRLSTAVQPNRIQQILYGQTLQPYIFSDLIGKALVERTSTPVALILVDRPELLELRKSVTQPLVCVAPGSHASAIPDGSRRISTAETAPPNISCHPNFLDDATTAQAILSRMGEGTDRQEPFGRVREAIAEARKMGATNRV